MEKDYEQTALLLAERYGIIKYEVKENIMIYEEEIKREGTYEGRINLDTLKEKRKKIS